MEHFVLKPDADEVALVVGSGEAFDQRGRKIAGVRFEVPLEDEGVGLLHDGAVAFVVETLAFEKDVLLGDLLGLLSVADVHDEREIDFVTARGLGHGEHGERGPVVRLVAPELAELADEVFLA